MKTLNKSTTKSNGGSIMNAKDYFVDDAYVDNIHNVVKHNLSARVYFKLPNGKKVPKGEYPSSHYVVGHDNISSGGYISTFICMRCSDGTLSDAQYVNECIEHIIKAANGLLTYNPDWIPVFKLEEDYWIGY